jgi:hypothetical protein
MTWYASEADVTREANDGRGPVDFKVSIGSADRTLVEFKLAKNTRFERNLRHQAEIYEKASDANRTIKVILYFTEAERARVDRILANLKLTGHTDICLGGCEARTDRAWKTVCPLHDERDCAAAGFVGECIGRGHLRASPRVTAIRSQYAVSR